MRYVTSFPIRQLSRISQQHDLKTLPTRPKGTQKSTSADRVDPVDRLAKWFLSSIALGNAKPPTRLAHHPSQPQCASFHFVGKKRLVLSLVLTLTSIGLQHIIHLPVAASSNLSVPMTQPRLWIPSVRVI
jgi:hypothetical protein